MTEHKPRDTGRVQGGPALSTPIGPNGRPLTLADLPAAGTKRWVIRRKAEVVAGVHAGLITLEEACRLYQLSAAEFRSWERLLESHGVAGLKATRARKDGRQPKHKAQHAAAGRQAG
ncbi:MAG TPA: DUF1153 domain-containing protein [Rhodospirillales bacterium]